MKHVLQAVDDQLNAFDFRLACEQSTNSPYEVVTFGGGHIAHRYPGDLRVALDVALEFASEGDSTYRTVPGDSATVARGEGGTPLVRFERLGRRVEATVLAEPTAEELRVIRAFQRRRGRVRGR